MSSTTSGGNGRGRVPPTEVKAKAQRRRFSAKYKQRLLREVAGCTKPGELSASQPSPPQGFAQQFYAWYRADQPGFEVDSNVDIDLGGGSSVTSSTAIGSFAKPAHPALASAGSAYAVVQTTDGPVAGAFVGAPTDIYSSQAGTAFDYAIEWIDAPGHELSTRYSVETVDTSGYPLQRSVVTQPGPPPGGSADLGFPSPPDVTPWTGIMDPVSWSGTAGESHDEIWLSLVSDGAMVGRYLLAPDESSAALPRLPTTGAIPPWWPAHHKRLVVGFCSGPGQGSCARYADTWRQEQ